MRKILFPWLVLVALLTGCSSVSIVSAPTLPLVPTHTPTAPRPTQTPAASVPTATAPTSLPSGTTAPATNANIKGRLWHDFCKPELPGQPAPAAQSPGCVPSEVGIYRANGILDSSESGIPGIRVQLGAGACLAKGLTATYTDPAGNYAFSGLNAGTYYVSVDQASPENAAYLGQGLWTFPGLGVGATTVQVLQRDTRTDVNFGWDYAHLP